MGGSVLRVLTLCLLLGFSVTALKNFRANNCPNPGNVLNNTCINTTTTDLNVTFVLYNSEYPNGVRIASNDTDERLRNFFIEDIDVKFVTHGWIESDNASSVVSIRKAYSSVFDYNVVTVDWSPISMKEFIITTFRVPDVGTVVGILVARLLELEVTTVDRVHLIGHSLGAHVMGTAGGFVRDSGYGKVARVTGLDPARPGYEGVRPRNSRLDDEDGRFVDIIHTSVGVLGYRRPIGQADFYPNGGFNNQPGCSLLSLDIFCSHHRSYEYFTESIYNEDAFPAVECDSYANFQANKCGNRPVVFMGNPTPPSTRGTYYLKTNFTGNSNS